jgi:hypothetical protein
MVFFNGAACGQGFYPYRDLNSGIYSDVDQFVALRFMRHVWVVNDNSAVMAAAVQKGGRDGHGLVLYKTLNEGADWTFESAVSGEYDVISDGVIDSDNNILLVTSLIRESRPSGVHFIKLRYEPSTQGWTVDPSTPVAVHASGALGDATRATISVDSNGVIWCAFRLRSAEAGQEGIVRIAVFYSDDGGYTWVDSGNRFGTPNRFAEKSAKVIAVGDRTALIFQDMLGDQLLPERYKSWAYREDYQPLQDAWTSERIALMMSFVDDPLGSHWSVAADNSGNLHLSYQDVGIRYLKYDAATGGWLDPVVAAAYGGSYNNISVAANGDLYLFGRFTNSLRVFCKRCSSANQRWSRWFSISLSPHLGYLRMCCPERFAERLPILYEVNTTGPYELLYTLFNTSPLGFVENDRVELDFAR